MKPRFFGCSLFIAAVGAALWLTPVGAAAQRAPARNADEARKASGPTPSTADGHPDLNGIWNGGMGGGGNNLADDSGERIAVTLSARGGTPVNFERDNTLLRRMDPNRPLYKPEFWEKVQNLDRNGSAEDPTYSCMPEGVPRIGPPSQIVQTPTQMIFLYQGRNTFRVIPTDGRPHSPESALEGTWNGESLGHWEGDTLAIDSIGFNDASWLGIAGYFHSEQMHVIERIRREGNTLTWQATVEDPGVLLKPWTVNARTVRLNPAPKAVLEEALPCSERDLAHLVTKEHH